MKAAKQGRILKSSKPLRKALSDQEKRDIETLKDEIQQVEMLTVYFFAVFLLKSVFFMNFPPSFYYFSSPRKMEMLVGKKVQEIY